MRSVIQVDQKLRPVFYVAGPFRGKSHWEQEQNIRRAEELALQVWAEGGAALCPHTNTRFFQGALPDDTWLQGDLALLLRCDAVLMTPDWARSTGATAEHDFALERKIEVCYNLEQLRDFIKFFNSSIWWQP